MACGGRPVRTETYDDWVITVPAFFIDSATPLPFFIYHDGEALLVTEPPEQANNTTFKHRDGELTVWHGDLIGLVGMWTYA